MPENIFNERIAANYDDNERSMFNDLMLERTCSVLAELAENQRALEFAIGTGRIALPLQKRGVKIHGIEISKPMVDKLYEKNGSVEIDVVIGDMASVRIPGSFQFVYLVYNTITNLITQEEQVNCFLNVAAHLHPGGYFVLEDLVPSIQAFPIGKTTNAFDASEEHIGIDEIDTVNQTVVSHHYWIQNKTVETFHSKHRYAWHGEYDLMARIAGLELQSRWGGWDKSDFTSDSKSHVSVWKKPSK